jgi:hypothetical protein
MKIVLGFKTVLRNPSDNLQRREGFKIICINCLRTPKIKTIKDISSAESGTM